MNEGLDPEEKGDGGDGQADDANSNVPKDNPFLLHAEGDDERTFVEIEELLTKPGDANWAYLQKHSVLFIGSAYNKRLLGSNAEGAERQRVNGLIAGLESNKLEPR